MKFIVDNQLPPALARLIQDELGEQASHVSDIGLQEATDDDIWSYASISNSILITKDEDFANMILQSPTAALLWVRIGNCRRVVLLELFRRVWPRVLQRLLGGDRFIEIR